jgi:hypothetical protein
MKSCEIEVEFSFVKDIFFAFEMVFCYQNCSSDREKLLKFEAASREFAKFSRQVRTIFGIRMLL